MQLLSSLSVLVRSPVALDLAPIQILYNQAINLSLEIKIKNGLCRSLVNFLLLPWPSFIPDHKLELRKQHLAAFLLSLTKDFFAIEAVAPVSGNEALHEKNLIKINETITMIRVQIDELNGADRNSREIYYECIKPFINHSISIFPAYVNYSEVCDEILSLFVVAIQVLRNQMGAEQVTSFVQTFLDIFMSNQHLYLAVAENQPTAIKVVEKFLKLLEFITCERGHSFQYFIPNTISLCMDHIYPSVAEKTAPEVKGQLFKVLHCIFDRNWKFFFKSSVQSSLGRSHWDTCEHEAQFIQIMQAFGQSFLQTDITIFKQNLLALESLNSKYKLYHKAAFKTSMLGQFITVLLQILIHKSHEILQEEITLTIYNMASVDFEGFFCAFLPHFLQEAEGLTESQKLNLKENFKIETDHPSFIQNSQKFVNDYRFYRICNENLPPGTIKF
ncbi:Exportin-6 [Armadillidium vulgare]|nr:Exportin-6 [Armadillidium vulgare]